MSGALSLNRRKARAELASAAAKASRKPDDPDAALAVDEKRRDYWAAELEDHISRVVDQAPPLTAEQRDRLALLLRPVAEAGGPDASA